MYSLNVNNLSSLIDFNSCCCCCCCIRKIPL